MKIVVNIGQRVVKPVWDNVKRVNQHKFSNNLKYPQARRTFVPSGVLTRTGLVNSVRPNGKKAVHNYDMLLRIPEGWKPKGNYMDHEVQRKGFYNTQEGNPEIHLQDHAVVDSGCSSHMTGNKAYLSDYEDYNEGFVAFGSDPKRGKITGKGKIRTANLDFDDVYFVDELKFNLFSVSQMCDKKNSVLFTDTECLILSPSFKLLDENQVVLRAPRQNGVYSLDLKNIVPSGGLENQLNHKVKIIRCDHGTEFKNHAMNEFCAKKGIKREFSVARTPQQNGVAERKNRTLIEAARTMLADSLLPIPFWAEAVNTACYVLNRVLVTKPQNKTPYELLIGKPPSISFMRPFGCPLTILNTLDPLGKFDGKSDEGYLLGYSTTSSLEKDKEPTQEYILLPLHPHRPRISVEGVVQAAQEKPSENFPVSVENQVNVDAGTQEHYVAGSSEKDKEPTQEYILLPLHPHRPRISVEDVVQAAQEKPSENFPKDNDVQDSEDVAEKEEQHTLTEAEQALKDDLERMIAQEIAAKAIDDATRQAFKEEKKRAAQATSINKLNTGRPSVSTSNSPLVSTANTPYASAASTPTGANTGGSSFVYLGGQIPIDASTLPNADLPIDPNMPDLEDDSNVFPNDGIFSGAYDDEDVGVEADFNNMDNTIDVSPIPTLRVHKDHPKGQILGDPKSAVQTRGKIQKASSVQQALRSYYIRPAVRPKDLKQDVKTYGVKNMTNAGTRAVVNTSKGKMDNDLKKSSYYSIVSNKPLVKDEDGVDVDVHVYMSMIGSLMYLTASRPDIMFAVYACARFQVTPKASHLNAVKRIFRQEYVAAANCCGKVLWIQNQMMDYGFNFMNTKIHIDNESTICIVKNPVYHSRTKHIEIRHHFIRDCYEKRLIDVIKIHTDANVADLLTKGFDVTRFNFLVVNIGMINL
ncbi:ribonuclease H-like domain-containing protein [Tanacetum coccineum]